ncbi:MAG: phage virion morphogenesis protein [Novosphingobium sp.]
MADDGGDLAELEPFLATFLNRLGPAQRRRVMRKIGQEVRRINTRRIAANVEPDGAAMEPRKPRARMKDAQGRIKRDRQKAGGKMFRKLRLARQIGIDVREDEVALSFKGNAAESAARHHFGLTGFVGKSARGKDIRTKYPRRRLLGFGPEDLDAITDAALGLLEEG